MRRDHTGEGPHRLETTTIEDDWDDPAGNDDTFAESAHEAPASASSACQTFEHESDDHVRAVANPN